VTIQLSFAVFVVSFIVFSVPRSILSEAVARVAFAGISPETRHRVCAAFLLF